MDTYNGKVKARADIAEALQTPKHTALADGLGLSDEDLEVIKTQGRLAEKADADQRSQLADGDAGITIKAGDIEAVLEGEALVRAKLPAVVGDLERAGNKRLALVLKRLSYDRFRIREIKVPAEAAAPTEAEAAELKTLERVAREDHLSQLSGFAKWVDAVRAPGREPIIAAFETRKTSDEALAKLGADALALSKQGRNVRRAVEATEREQAAVEAQLGRWNASKRLIKLAARQDPDLKNLFADC